MDEEKQTNQTDKKEQERTIQKKNLIITTYYKAAGNISHLCKEAGIARATFYEWLKEDEKFKADIEEQKEALIDFVESKLFALIQKDDKSSIYFFLKCKAKDRGYVEKQEFAPLDVNIRYVSHIPQPEKKKKSDNS